LKILEFVTVLRATCDVPLLRGRQRKRHDSIVRHWRVEETATGRGDDDVLAAVLAEVGARRSRTAELDGP
jgi:hypothetical protein